MNYVDIAKRDIGLREVKGPQHSARISGWLSKLKAWWKDDETPWCGVAMAGWLSEAGLPYPKEFYRAMAWKDYGVRCSEPLYGAIAVLERKGGGHVGIVTGISFDGSKIRLLGGNQNDSVCEAWFDTNRIAALRQPVGIALSPCMITAVGAFSRSEA